MMIACRPMGHVIIVLAVISGGCQRAATNPDPTTAPVARADGTEAVGAAPDEDAVDKDAPESRRDEDDRRDILGSWRVVEATANGERYREAVGTIYTFEASNKVHIVGHDYEAYFDYQLDPSRAPKHLLTSSGRPRGSGIYTLHEDTLRYRVSREPQSLAFDAAQPPHGRWNEFHMIRVTPAEARVAIEKLQDERLGIKASARPSCAPRKQPWRHSAGECSKSPPTTGSPRLMASTNILDTA